MRWQFSGLRQRASPSVLSRPSSQAKSTLVTTTGCGWRECARCIRTRAKSSRSVSWRTDASAGAYRCLVEGRAGEGGIRAKRTRGVRGPAVALRHEFKRVRHTLGVGLFAHIPGDVVVAAEHLGELVLADDDFRCLHVGNTNGENPCRTARAAVGTTCARTPTVRCAHSRNHPPSARVRPPASAPPRPPSHAILLSEGIRGCFLAGSARNSFSRRQYGLTQAIVARAPAAFTATLREVMSYAPW
jgi:hypothetical protein